MCEYCNITVAKLQHTTIFKTIENHGGKRWRILRIDDTWFVDFVNKTQSESIEIKYCPMCGCRLTAEEQTSPHTHDQNYAQGTHTHAQNVYKNNWME